MVTEGLCARVAGFTLAMRCIQFDQHQQRRCAAEFFWRLMESHYIRVLRQPERGLLLQDVFTMTMHHAGTVNMLATARSEERAEFLFGL